MANEVEINVERVIAAPPDVLYVRVSDVVRMGDLSPENVGATWLRGATGPAVGARFKGENRNGKKKWSTVATITEAEPGRHFAFEVAAGPFKVARWSYRFEPVDGGCRVTETWIDRRGWVAHTMAKRVSGTADRAGRNRETMTATLERLAALSEAAG
jgi:hypothetical protein